MLSIVKRNGPGRRPQGELRGSARAQPESPDGKMGELAGGKCYCKTDMAVLRCPFEAGSNEPHPGSVCGVSAPHCCQANSEPGLFGSVAE